MCRCGCQRLERPAVSNTTTAPASNRCFCTHVRASCNSATPHCIKSAGRIATAQHLYDNVTPLSLLVARIALLEGLPMIAGRAAGRSLYRPAVGCLPWDMAIPRPDRRVYLFFLPCCSPSAHGSPPSKSSSTGQQKGISYTIQVAFLALAQVETAHDTQRQALA